MSGMNELNLLLFLSPVT